MKIHQLIYLTTLILFGCNSPKILNDKKLKITLNESYNLIELGPMIKDALKFLEKQRLDSLANNKSGNELIDKIRKENAKNGSAESFEINPLFQGFYPNTKSSSDGNGSTLDTSTIIGTIRDSVILKKCLTSVASIFPEDIDWKITGRLVDNHKNLHAFKTKTKVIELDENSIDYFIVMPTGLHPFGCMNEKVADLTSDRKYWVKMQLKPDISKLLDVKSYTVLIKIGLNEYSGSIVNFRDRPKQYILVGEMTGDDFDLIKNKFKDRIKIKNGY